MVKDWNKGEYKMTKMDLQVKHADLIDSYNKLAGYKNKVKSAAKYIGAAAILSLTLNIYLLIF